MILNVWIEKLQSIVPVDYGVDWINGLYSILQTVSCKEGRTLLQKIQTSVLPVARVVQMHLDLDIQQYGNDTSMSCMEKILVEMKNQMHIEAIQKWIGYYSVLNHFLNAFTTFNGLTKMDASTGIQLLCSWLEATYDLFCGHVKVDLIVPSKKTPLHMLRKAKNDKKQFVLRRQRKTMNSKSSNNGNTESIAVPSSADVERIVSNEIAFRRTSHKGRWEISHRGRLIMETGQCTATDMLLHQSGWSCCGNTQKDSLCTAVYERIS